MLHACAAGLPRSIGEGLLALLAVNSAAVVVFVLLAETGLASTATVWVALIGIVTWADVIALKAIARIHGFEEKLLEALPVSRTALLTGLAGGGLSLALIFVLPYMPPDDPSQSPWYIEEISGPIDAGGMVVMWIAVACVIAPIGEELIFRGWLQPALIQAGWNPILSIGAVSLLFGALHPDILAATGSGVIFGVLRHASGRLAAPMVAHAAHNFAVGVWVLAEDGPYGLSELF